MSEKQIMDSAQFTAAIKKLAEEIIADIDNYENIALIGIQSRGVDIAARINKFIEERTGKKLKFGILDITFYRDDLASRGRLPEIKETQIDFDIADMTLILIDDVLFTGRTIKAALENLTSFGRPYSIKLCVLIDRGNRELPIQADYCSFKLDTSLNDKVNVMTDEHDGNDGVVLISD